MSEYKVFYGPYFSIFELNRKIYSVNLRIYFESKNTDHKNFHSLFYFNKVSDDLYGCLFKQNSFGVIALCCLQLCFDLVC